MVAVILTIHTLIVLALIGVVLLQRSEGGAVLSGGNFMTGRGTANALTRTTSALAAVFFVTSLALAIIAARGERARSVVEELTGGGAASGPAKSTDDLLRSLGTEPDSGRAILAPGAAGAPTETAVQPAPDAAPAEAPPSKPETAGSDASAPGAGEPGASEPGAPEPPGR